jgi:type IV pilus assembly protein PilM
MSNFVGVDIGSYSIKMVVLEKDGQGFRLDKIASAYNPVGHFLPGDDKQFEQLTIAVKGLLVENKLVGKKLAMSLPENHVFSSIVEMPTLTAAELSSAIQWEAEQHLPISLKSVNLEYSVIEKYDNKMKVLLVAAKKEVVDRLMSLSEMLESEVSLLETSLLALGRSYLINSNEKSSVMLCNMGALSTDIMILKDFKPVFLHSVATGGLALTRGIERGLAIKASQAEEYKRAYGLDKTQLEGKVASMITPVLNVILSEVKKSIQYFQSEGQRGQIGRVIISGGGAYLPELASYMTSVLGFEVVMLNPFEKIKVDGVSLPKEIASFGVAMGLAAREVD